MLGQEAYDFWKGDYELEVVHAIENVRANNTDDHLVILRPVSMSGVAHSVRTVGMYSEGRRYEFAKPLDIFY